MNIALIFSRTLAVIFATAGFFGFFKVQIPYVVQLDLWQSMIYLALGALGFYFGWFYHTDKNVRIYNEVATGILLFFFLLGLTWPNLGDILHLEEEENIFHGALFALGVITSALTSKKKF